MTCTAELDIGGYLPVVCGAPARDRCRECQEPFCPSCIDALGRCAVCAPVEDDPMDALDNPFTDEWDAIVGEPASIGEGGAKQ